MFFEDYLQHKDATIRENLFWEYDMNRFDWQKMKSIVVQRVIERGFVLDFYAMFNLYDYDDIVNTVKNIPYLNKKDMSFVCALFNLKKEDLKCYTSQPSVTRHWNS